MVQMILAYVGSVASLNSEDAHNRCSLSGLSFLCQDLWHRCLHRCSAQLETRCLEVTIGWPPLRAHAISFAHKSDSLLCALLILLGSNVAFFAACVLLHAWCPAQFRVAGPVVPGVNLDVAYNAAELLRRLVWHVAWLALLWLVTFPVLMRFPSCKLCYMALVIALELGARWFSGRFLPVQWQYLPPRKVQETANKSI